MLRSAIPLLLVVALAGCGDEGDTDSGESADVAAFTLRVQLLTADNATTVWGRAESLAEARAAAEAAANLIVGSGGPDYGDRDGNGTVDGESEFGVLPGLDGTPPGLAELVDNECIEADVLGGSWDDPAARWGELQSKVDAWAPDNNTIPDLASNPMRIVAWANLTQATDSLDEARDLGSRAKSNIALSLAAIDC